MASLPGKLITFEGGEGTGKSTQAKRLADRLRVMGREVVLTREPGGTPGAEVIRYLLLSGVVRPLGPEAETFMFAAARDDHVAELIRPALARGAWVVCDRFIDSTRIYQGVLEGVEQRLIHALERVVVGDAMPALTIILDLPAEVGLARVQGRGGGADRFEAEEVERHQTIREAYHALAGHEPERCAIIDADQSPDALAQRVWMLVSERLLRERKPAVAPRASA
jgi:dTMP kinase